MTNTPSNVVKLVTEPRTPNKASIRTMMKLDEKYGGLPSKLTREDGEIDYQKIVDIYTMLCQQDNPSLTADDVMDGLDQGKLDKVITYIAEALSINVPDAMLTGQKEEESVTKRATSPKAKDQGEEEKKPKNPQTGSTR